MCIFNSDLGYSNEGEKWKSKYESESFEEDTRVLFEEVYNMLNIQLL